MEQAHPRIPPGPDDRGLYLLWLALAADQRIEVGRLGRFDFCAGLYVYVGSAQRRRSARIARHLRLEKPLRWHIDYVRRHARVLAVSLVEGTRAGECHLAGRLTAALGAWVAVPRFGASDCRCPGHLLVLPGEPLPDVAGPGLEGFPTEAAPWRRLGFTTHLVPGA